MGIKYKIIQFNINEFGVNIIELKKEISFKSLGWDKNDIKLSQLRFLITKYINDKKVILQEAQCFLDGRIVPNSIQELISSLSIEDQRKFHAYKPFRKRGISQFMVEYVNKQWEVNHVTLPELTDFAQREDHPLDLRKLIRRFPPMDKTTTQSILLRILIKKCIEMLCECEPQVKLKK